MWLPLALLPLSTSFQIDTSYFAGRNLKKVLEREGDWVPVQVAATQIHPHPALLHFPPIPSSSRSSPDPLPPWLGPPTASQLHSVSNCTGPLTLFAGATSKWLWAAPDEHHCRTVYNSRISVPLSSLLADSAVRVIFFSWTTNGIRVWVIIRNGTLSFFTFSPAE